MQARYIYETLLFTYTSREGAGSLLCAVNSQDLQTAKKHAEELDPSVPLSFLQACTVQQLMMQPALSFLEAIEDAMSLYAEIYEHITTHLCIMISQVMPVSIAL